MARKLKTNIKKEEKNVEDDEDDTGKIQPPPLIHSREKLAKALTKNIKEGISNVDNDNVVKILVQTPVHPRNRLAKK